MFQKCCGFQLLKQIDNDCSVYFISTTHITIIIIIYINALDPTISGVNSYMTSRLIDLALCMFGDPESRQVGFKEGLTELLYFSVASLSYDRWPREGQAMTMGPGHVCLMRLGRVCE